MFLEPAFDPEIPPSRHLGDDATLAWQIFTRANSLAQGSIDRFLDFDTMMAEGYERDTAIHGIGFIATFVTASSATKSKGYALTLRPHINHDAVVEGHNLTVSQVDRTRLVVVAERSFVTRLDNTESKQNTRDEIERVLGHPLKRATLQMLAKLTLPKNKTDFPPLDGPTVWALLGDGEPNKNSAVTTEPDDRTSIGESFIRWIAATVDLDELRESEASKIIARQHSVDGTQYAAFALVKIPSGDYNLEIEDADLAKRDAGEWTRVDSLEELALVEEIIKRGTDVSPEHAAGIRAELPDRDNTPD